MERTFVPISLTHPELAAEWSDRNREITPETVTAGSHDNVWWKGSCGHEWQAPVIRRTNGAGCPYCTSRIVLPGFNDLQTKRPKIAKEWNFERNGDLTPERIMPHSNKKVWWICGNGHEYQMTPNSRSKGYGCAVCSGKKALAGFNDLATRYPALAKEWSDRNLPLTPDRVFKLSGKQSFWWTCPECGNDYYSDLRQRIYNGSGCPYCEGFKVLPGFNDLATTDPDIAAEWNAYENGSARPDGYFRSSRKIIRWNCPRGHTYSCSIIDRAVERKLCVVCEAEFAACLAGLLTLLYAKRLGLRAVPGHSTGSGNVLEVFLPEKNAAIETERVSEEMRGVQRSRQLRCEEESVRLFLIPRMKDNAETVRIVKEVFSLLCMDIRSDDTDDLKLLRREFFGPPGEVSPRAGRFIGKKGKVQGFKAISIEPLSKTNPELIPEWSERNYPFTIDDEVRTSADMVWWKGRCGHEWQALVSNRAAGRGCPYCSGHQVLRGFNDFASLHPDLAGEWSEKNGDLKPDQFTEYSTKRVIWKCGKGHEWTTQISNRTRGNGCPVCAKEPVRQGENDLATTCPEVLGCWSEKNRLIRPEEISENYPEQVWWTCPGCGKDFLARPKTKIRYLRRYGSPNCRDCLKEIQNHTKGDRNHD